MPKKRRRGRWRGWLWGLGIYALVVLFSDDSLDVDLDLGAVQYPDYPRSYDSAEHIWRTKGLATTRVVYGHGHEAIRELEADHLAYGRRMDRAFMGGFASRLGTNCPAEPWSCVYTEVFRRNAADLEPLLKRIARGLDEQRWSAKEASRWLLRFVQNIPYRIPEQHAFGVLPPALVASQNWGDCDSKSLLLLHLLRYVGIDAQITISRVHAHAMVGIFVPTSGATFTYRGREYAWAETTADAPIGWISPEMLRTNDWQVKAVRQSL